MADGFGACLMLIVHRKNSPACLPCVLDGRHHDDELATLNAGAVRLGNLTYTGSGAKQWRLGRRTNA